MDCQDHHTSPSCQISPIHIRIFSLADQEAVVDLWRQCELVRSWNDPHKDIQRKLNTQPELFFVAEIANKIVASIMAGFDGHRGWVNYLAVAPRHRQMGVGRALMRHVETALTERGCPKLNLQVRATNQQVLTFYERLGYVQEEVVSLGKRLISDEVPARIPDVE
jgi:ribosomal protein S18 acetylase RimI-like enzyme